MKIQKAAEDYLETMLILKEQKGYIRSVDIAQRMGVKKPSVTYSTKRLRENGYITMNEDGMISLTESGMEIADRIYTRHKVLSDFFIKLGVPEDIAREDACKVEHDISPETFDAITKLNRQS